MNDLKKIISSIPVHFIGEPEFDPIFVTGITLDSRQVKPGDIFVAALGGSVDGHDYIGAAIEKGAAAVIGTRTIPDSLPVPYLQTDDSRFALAHVAAALYDFPARDLCMIGITGTDGKTSTSTLLYHVLRTAGIQTGMITTVNAVIGEEVLDTGFHVTTPEAVDVQRYLAMMRDAGLTHVILETTSHGLVQHRVTACEYDLGIVTNITHEHLDYHGSYENYRAAKGMLFSQLSETSQKPDGNLRIAVLNRNDDSYEYLHQISTGREISYAIQDGSANFSAENIRQTPDGMHFTISNGDENTGIHSNLVGTFNISNILAAFSAAVGGLGISAEIAARGIKSMPGVPGRMERIDLGQDFTAIVDFAHTPNALSVAISTLNQLKSKNNKLWAVFGSAGLRDREKRRMMAEVSVQLADYTILTAEDPRTESLSDILEMMANAAISKGAVENGNFWRIPDRGAAIQFAVQHAQPGDIVCAFGKGHEQSMCFGIIEYPWDDRIAMKAALVQRLDLTGEVMPYLPTQD